MTVAVSIVPLQRLLLFIYMCLNYYFLVGQNEKENRFDLYTSNEDNNDNHVVEVAGI